MASTTAPRVKRALLIGIDDYPKLTKLQGCVSDVKLMRSVLVENFGFPVANMRMLLDAEATRDLILEAFDHFVDGVGENDIVVIHYAGHGSLMTDREGDEPSGYDSTIMPFDSEGWQGENRDITDDEINLRLQRLGEKTSFITLLFDCCHSGTISRDDFGALSRSMPPDRRPVEKLPPSPIPQELRTGKLDSGPSGWMPLADKYVLIAGCRDEEVSYEYRPPEGDGQVVHGALTYFLTQELTRATPGTTYRDVFERAAARVNAANARQHPQMEGKADREVFGVRDIEPMMFVRVNGRTEDTVEIAAGAAQGITVGSKYAVYPQGTKLVEGESPLGEIEVTAVGAVTSDAKIVSGDPEAIEANARAFEIEHAYGTFRFDVQLFETGGFEDDVAALRNGIEASKLLDVVAADQPAAARIYLLQSRSEPGEGETVPVPQLGRLDEPVWAVVTGGGQLLMPPKKPADTRAVIDNLEKLARYRQALDLENPDPTSTYRGLFSLELLRKAADGEWVVAQPEASSGEVVYEEGETIAFRVKSRHDQPAFAYLLDFGLSGAIQQIYPARGAQEAIRPNGWFEFGTDPRMKLPLGFPKGFPYAKESGVPGAEAGVETIRLIVTSSEADFGFLSQSGVRGGPSPPPPAGSGTRSTPPPPPAVRSPLEHLWETATQGAKTRDILTEPVKMDDWTAVSRSFVLRRRSDSSLQADGKPLNIGGVQLATPGLEGEVRTHAWGSDRATAAELRAGELTGALGDAGIDVRQTVEISKAREVGPATRSAHGAPAMELTLRDPGPGFGQMVMTTDELGIVTWHFAPPPEPAEGARGAGVDTPRTYVIPRTVNAIPEGETGKRGLVGMVGRKFLKELVFPLVDPVVGAVTHSFAGRWEAKNRPYRVRTFTPDDFGGPGGQTISGDGWKQLGTGRSLLMIHGTFSRAHAAFGAMPADFVRALHEKYEGRVFALDHHTLSHDPRQNVNWLIDQLPGDVALDLDVICHSRGGMVSRLLSEKQGDLNLGSRTLRVGKVVFVGSPNAGTILADGSHLGDLIDTFTNLLNFIPDPGISDILAGVVTVAKQLAVGAVSGLPGLRSMQPDGEFAKWLNAGPRAGDTRYFALASDFTPSEPGLREFARNRAMDLIFGGGNDLVVPTEGVFAENGSGFFPIEEKVVFSGPDSVAHTAYFAKRAAREKIMEWLSA